MTVALAHEIRALLPGSSQSLHTERMCPGPRAFRKTSRRDALHLQAQTFTSYDLPGHPFFGIPSDELETRTGAVYFTVQYMIYFFELETSLGSEIWVPAAVIRRLVFKTEITWRCRLCITHHLHCLVHKAGPLTLPCHKTSN